MECLDPEHVQQLLERAKEDPGALIELENVMGSWVRRRAKAMLYEKLGKYMDVEDDTWDVWGRVFPELLERGTHAEEIFNWLATIVDREVKQRVGQLLELKGVKVVDDEGEHEISRIELELDPVSAEQAVLGAVDHNDPETKAEIENVLAMLRPGRERQGAELYLLYGEDYREVSQVARVTPVNARKIVSRGRHALEALRKIPEGEQPKWDQLRQRLLRKMGKRL